MATTVEKARAHLKRLDEARNERQRKRRDRLMAKLTPAAELLRERYGVEDVRLFGSLANGDLTGRIDVDLAAGSLDSNQYFAALADLMELFEGPVDLVRLEEASDALRARIEEEGRRL